MEPISAAILAAGTLGSAWIGSGSRESISGIQRTAERERAEYLQREFAKHSAGWRVDDLVSAGKRHGIHPLAMMGQQGTSFHPVQVGATTGGRGGDYNPWSRASREMAKIAAAMIETKAEKEKVELAQMKLNFYKDMINARTQATKVPANLASSIGEVNLVNPKVEMKKSEIPMSDKMGVTAGFKPLEDKYIDKAGNVWYMVSMSASEPLESDWFSKGMYMLQKAADYLGGINSGILRSVFRGREGSFMKYLRKVRPQAPAGKEWRYNIWKGRFRLAPRRNRFFDHQTLWDYKQ